MPTLLRTEPARKDLAEIWLGIAFDNLPAADRLIDQIETKLLMLSENPGLGQERDELSPALRSWPLGNYLLFYREISDGIELIRVLHGARNLRRAFRRKRR